uniref:Acid phosphatase n=2 Tax=Leptocylindrus danicus TaxID=163516 RepID=A0A7S2K0L1_9STRA
MDTMVSEIIQNAHKGRDGNEEFYPLHIYSAHDSTLIGLMCALRLEQPSQWPEYASALKIEIFEVECEEENNSSGFKRIRRYCRFSLNDTILSCTVGGASSEAVCLDELSSVLYSCRNGIEV